MLRNIARRIPKSLRTVARRHGVPVKAVPLPSISTATRMPVGAPGSFTQARFYSDGDTLIKVPTMGDSISEGTVSAWNVGVGEFAAADDVVVVLETDKVSIDVRAPTSGTVTEHCAEEDETVLVGADLFRMKEGGEAPAGSAAPKAEEAAPAKEAAPAAAPAAPTPAPAAAPAKPATPAPAAAPAPASGERTEKVVPMTRMRKTIATRLKQAQNTAAMLTTFNEIDMSNLMALRSEYKDAFFETHGVKLGFMSGFVRGATIALQDQPIVNAVIDEEVNNIIYRDYVDISVAVATPKGLVVPVLRDCQHRSFADVEKGIVELGERARAGQLGMEDMTGGTFTISNGGVYGSLMGTPILNLPQSAILGMHGIFQRPVAVNGQVEIRPMMYVALTYDHRLIDGREAVTFLRKIKDTVEDPRRALLGL